MAGSAIASSNRANVTESNIYQVLAEYEKPVLRKAVWQLLNTLIPYAVLWCLMVYTVLQDYSYWITLGLSVMAVPFMVRTFIMFHDCGHGSFFASHRANRILGYISGILTMTPYEDWQRAHAGHHATSGDLDRRGEGDIWTMTVEEYRAAPWYTRLGYRMYRNPFVMLVLGPITFTVFLQRLWHPGARKRERFSVIVTNISLLALVILASLTIGFLTLIKIQLPITLMGGAIGVWLFYVQHQYESTDWTTHEEWDTIRMALEGSSYYKLPKVLQWCTGNIGLHHIHHVRPRIPNYNLQKACDEIPLLRDKEPLTFWRSLKSLRMNLWDKKRNRLVSFGVLKTIPQE